MSIFFIEKIIILSIAKKESMSKSKIKKSKSNKSKAILPYIL
jgi:hypothetical protein